MEQILPKYVPNIVLCVCGIKIASVKYMYSVKKGKKSYLDNLSLLDMMFNIIGSKWFIASLNKKCLSYFHFFTNNLKWQTWSFNDIFDILTAI